MPLANGTPTPPVANEDIPEERLQAKNVVLSTWIPVGEHFYDDIGVVDIPLTVPEDAQFLKLQALDTNIRYRIDGGTCSTVIGFQLASESEVLIPCAVDTIHICGEGAGSYQGQWVR